MFSELYMIFKGKVTLSLANKDENEYFSLHSSNFFGDYQILLGLRAAEVYKACSSVEYTYCQCIKRKQFLDLIGIDQTSFIIFNDRAIERRTEFRRIRKVYEKFAGVNKIPEVDAKNVQDVKKYTIKTYSDLSNAKEMPPFLTDPDFYF